MHIQHHSDHLVFSREPCATNSANPDTCVDKSRRYGRALPRNYHVNRAPRQCNGHLQHPLVRGAVTIRCLPKNALDLYPSSVFGGACHLPECDRPRWRHPGRSDNLPMRVSNVRSEVHLRTDSIDYEHIPDGRFGEVSRPPDVDAARSVLNKQIGSDGVEIGHYRSQVNGVASPCFLGRKTSHRGAGSEDR